MSTVTIDIGGVLIPRIIDSVSLRRPSQKWQRFVPAKPAGVPNQRTKVGDRVRICWDGDSKRPALLGANTWRVVEVCPQRGVRTFTELAPGFGPTRKWHRSWVRVKGGAA